MFKNSFLKIRIKSQLKKNKISRANKPYKKVKTVGILFTVEDRQKHEHIKILVKKLESEGKETKVLCFLPPKKENYEFLFDYFSKNELNFWGKIESHDVDNFISQPFDILYNPDKTPNLMLNYILAASKASFRVGNADESLSNFFELMIKNNNGSVSLIDDMYKYTNQLR